MLFDVPAAETDDFEAVLIVPAFDAMAAAMFFWALTFANWTPEVDFKAVCAATDAVVVLADVELLPLPDDLATVVSVAVAL